jgi:hypothetical protein
LFAGLAFSLSGDYFEVYTTLQEYTILLTGLQEHHMIKRQFHNCSEALFAFSSLLSGCEIASSLARVEGAQ